jgi:peptidoglycan/LPS O-acetylase OafA/YrhL
VANKAQRQMVAVAGVALAAIAVLIPVQAVRTVSGQTLSCGAAITAAFHQWPGCRDAAPPYLIGAVVLLAATAMVVIGLRQEDEKATKQNAPE